jgi:transposase
VQAARQTFQQVKAELEPENTHFIDECGVNDAMVPTRGRAKRGKRVKGTKPRTKGRHRTIIGTMSLRYGLEAIPWPGKNRRPDFISWAEAVLIPRLRPGDTVILDNASIHKGKELEELVAAAGAKLQFLPPYSPDFNPIEEAWSKFKNLLRRASAHSLDLLAEAVAQAAQAITIPNIRGYVTHAGYLAST